MFRKYSSLLANIYIFLIAFSIFPILFFTLSAIDKTDIPIMLFWIVVFVAAEYKPIIINESDGENEITLSFAAHFPSIMLIGMERTVWIGIISTLIIETILRKPWNKRIFNAGQYGITLFISGYLFEVLRMTSTDMPIDVILDMPSILLTATVYVMLNTFFISVIIYLTSNEKFIDILLADYKIILGYFYSLVPVSIAVVSIYDENRPYTIFVMIPPLILMLQSVRRYYSLHSEARSTLTVLAEIIDQRDQYTYAHSARVAKYARQIAEQLNLSTSEINRIETAGLVHDLGKISIEDQIIKKDGKLTNEEFDQIKGHPGTAYKLLRNLQPYRKCAEYVLYHHERFDGKGYPTNISDKTIPLGARVLTVADSYDAMTSDRPYRKGMIQSHAVSELIKNRGSQFDPYIVDAFIQVLKSEYGYLEEE